MPRTGLRTKTVMVIFEFALITHAIEVLQTKPPRISPRWFFLASTHLWQETKQRSKRDFLEIVVADEAHLVLDSFRYIMQVRTYRIPRARNQIAIRYHPIN